MCFNFILVGIYSTRLGGAWLNCKLSAVQTKEPTLHDVCMEVSNVFIFAICQIFLSRYAGKGRKGIEHFRYVIKILENTLKKINVLIDPMHCSFDSFI